MDRDISSETTVDGFYQWLAVRAATIDELLSEAFEALPGQKTDTEHAARRLAAWCRASASGDWSLFAGRLERDGLSFAQVLERFATVRRRGAMPAWIADAVWIEAALQRSDPGTAPPPEPAEPYPFEQLFAALAEQANTLLWSGLDAKAADRLNEGARTSLRLSLLKQLSDLCTPALYERFAKARSGGKVHDGAVASAEPIQADGASHYRQFIGRMHGGGFRNLFEDKPVLLRLIATVTRQWIDTSREFVVRLAADLPALRRELLPAGAPGRVASIEGGLSDSHNGGRTVHVVTFEDGARVVYKPKDMRLDLAWHGLIERLNGADPPLQLKAARGIAREGYGWSEFIAHDSCVDQQGCARFFRRAGAWLALLHCFAATDMHQENMIATGEHPVPIDLEMILQAKAEEYEAQDREGEAFDAAMEIIANSVMLVGLLPAYGRSVDHSVFSMGGMTGDWTSRTVIKWNDINSDGMRPVKFFEPGTINPNLPHVEGKYAAFGEHVDEFIAGFAAYAKFLLRYVRSAVAPDLFAGFAGTLVRRIVRPTRFYYMLLQRLKDHRTMDDGAVWSAQADFIARLSEWDKDADPLWPLQRAERAALLSLNVPHLVSPADGNEVRDAAGVSVRTGAASGMDRAQARVRDFDEPDIAWQTEVIEENANSVLATALPVKADEKARLRLAAEAAAAPSRQVFAAEADKIAADLSRYAVRRGSSAAWIGLDWLGDTEVFQLVCLGSDLYNGAPGIALFLAAHAAVTGSASSRELALAGIVHLRKKLKGRGAARMARSLGIGGGVGLGSIVYGLAVMARFLDDATLLEDAHVAARLFSDDLIAADTQLDVIGGSAGAILGLLRLYGDSRSGEVLARAVRCGEHLIGQPRSGEQGRRSWVGKGSGSRALNGMSHGAAGYAYALASLAAAAGRADFAAAARECLAFENSTYDAARSNWPDLRGAGEPFWPCQWCHGAPGIGLARLAMTSRAGVPAQLDFDLTTDVRHALEATKRSWPGHVDTLCCGTLGSIEFFCDAGKLLDRSDLREVGARQLMAIVETAAVRGDFRWNGGRRRFNLGLFRGLAGVGYTLLRQVDATLPNVIIWQ